MKPFKQQHVPQSLASAQCIQRHPKNPVLSAEDIPYPSTLVFNAGIAYYNEEYIMVFRNDYGVSIGDFEKYNRGDTIDYPLAKTNLGYATSKDGINWEVDKAPIFDSDPKRFAQLAGLEQDEVGRVYDPRISIIDDQPYLCLALDTRHGVRGVIVSTDCRFRNWKVLHVTAPDNRNMVLFPQKINGEFIRLERPFPVYSRYCDRFDIWIGKSIDLQYWGKFDLLLGVEHVPFANDKLGPATPPILTDHGWLVIFHAVDRDDTRGRNGWEKTWKKRYTAGVALLDATDPRKVIGMSKAPLIAPEAHYETTGGFRNNVIFPCGLTVDNRGSVKIWYGASDTCIALATCELDDLIQLCTDSI